MQDHCHPAKRCDFYPRPPRGGRRFDLDAAVKSIQISIHALREEGDSAKRRLLPVLVYFYPRPPRGGRPMVVRVVAGM